MITSLQIQDYALIENIQIYFGRGLNIITGETGAGKSILIDALGLLLGERASTEVVRRGSKKAVVEGVFEVANNPKVTSLLEKNEIETGAELFVRREISLKGSNRCFLNDTPVTLNIVREIGNLLIDLHGQHEHQSLLRTETHIEMLDDFGDLTNEFMQFTEMRKVLIRLLDDLKDLRAREESIKEKKELYGFQIKEIDEVGPVADEEEKLELELNLLENAERLIELTSKLYEGLYDNEDAAYNLLSGFLRELSELTEIDSSFEEKEKDFNSAISIIEDLATQVRRYRDNVELDPEKLEEVRDRLGALSHLKKKYGGSLKSVIEYREKIGAEFDLAENYSEKIEELVDEINTVRISAGKLAAAISEKRISVSERIKLRVEEELVSLGIADSNFQTMISQRTAEGSTENYILYKDSKIIFNDYGFDEVEFYISTNIGEDAKPLAKVASGGEISRIMLAMKSVLAKDDKLPLLVFDEIDTGVSGRIAQKVGEALKSLAEFHQIISITHLPQIAGLADHHYAVSKKLEGERVVSNITRLGDEERVVEVAKLISGEDLTDSSLESARELMGIKN